MYFLNLTVLVATVLAVATLAKEETPKNRDKRQQVAFYPRRGARPPPYAVQMEPIVQYSQRDPLYNPLVSSKSDEPGFYEEPPIGYYPTEPEPIIEIIIKESNESLPTPVPPQPLPQQRPTKEPIQVFYVKYEKKKGYGDGKSQVVYDPPVPALTPVEEHEEIKSDHPEPYPEEPVSQVTPAPTEPSTTLRAIIRPDSEVYHPGSSGIRVTFGTEQLPPNNHNKRSDNEKQPVETAVQSKSQAQPLSQAASTSQPPAQSQGHRVKPHLAASVPPGTPKRQHGPYQPIQPVHQRVPPAFPQQRIVNSFAGQQALQQTPQQLPLNFIPQQHQQFQGPPHIRNSLQRPQRLPISIQGLPEVQQRAPFSNFGPPHRISINHPQQPGFPPTLSVSHQNVHLQNQPLNVGNPSSNFNNEPTPLQHQPQQHSSPQLQSYTKQQQELEKQRYHEQRRQQELLKHREHQRQHEQQRHQEHQQRLLEQQRQIEQQQRQIEQQRQVEQQRLIEQQRQQEHQRLQEQRLQEQRRRKQEQEQKLLQEQQYHSSLKYNQAQLQNLPQIPIQQQAAPQRPSQEIFKAVPKLEQHYAIRENPLHPGPFPPNPSVVPTSFPEVSHNQYFSSQKLNNQESQNLVRSSTNRFGGEKIQQHVQNHQQTYFGQNLVTPQPQQQRTSSSSSSSQQQSIWGRPLFGGNNQNPSQKIYATPVSPTAELDRSQSVIRHHQPTTVTTPSTTTTTTEAPTTTTTLSPKNEAKIKENIANLPDEVPDDIREQLLSSGILGNADIQILDYDKVGDIPIEKLPPEALANFYGAGGAAAVAASEPVPAVLSKGSKELQTEETNAYVSKKAAQTKIEQATLRPGGVEMKVVRFDPNTEQGQAVAGQHIREDATRLEPVSVGPRDEAQYNRYLPLKVSGASFPIPDAPELNGRKISSVVVLAPVDYNFQEEEEIDARQGRKVSDVQAVRFLAGDTLKQLVKKPSAENYEKWLEQESRTEPQRQSVVLLVTTPKDSAEDDKEIFMYDVSSRTVSKLSGDLSTAFVDAAESNSDSTDPTEGASFSL